MVFQHAQQFCLEREGHLAYLVQKEGPAFRQFEQAFLARGPGPRERPRLIAEELGFHEFMRDGRAIDRDEIPRAARTGGMDGLRDHVLARAVLAKDQDGFVMLGKASSLFLEHAHGGTFSHDGVERHGLRALLRADERGIAVIGFQLAEDVLHLVDLVLAGRDGDIFRHAASDAPLPVEKGPAVGDAVQAVDGHRSAGIGLARFQHFQDALPRRDEKGGGIEAQTAVVQVVHLFIGRIGEHQSGLVVEDGDARMQGLQRGDVHVDGSQEVFMEHDIRLLPLWRMRTGGERPARYAGKDGCLL